MSCPTGTIQGCDFAQYLVQETPVFDEMIMEDIRPTDGWIGNVSTGTRAMGTPTEVTQDRFKHVYPDVTQKWDRTSSASCTGTPCDPNEAQIGWGAERITWYEEQQSWATPLLCYDQEMNITHAKENLAYIISDILKPATSAIASNFLRRRTLQWGNAKLVANSAMSTFTYNWVSVGNSERYFDCNVAPTNVFKLVPQMLQFWWEPLMRNGYGGKNPFEETAPYIELVTDINTCWELDKLGGSTGVGGVPSVAANWRFEQWNAANKYWRYGFSGQIGNYLTRVDPFGLRFNYIGPIGAQHRYQVVLPYVNSVTSGAGGAAGLGDTSNPDYDRAHFALSFVSHKKGLQLLVPESGSVNPEMPFAHRNFAGKWQFVMDNLGADSNGVAINNKRRNKGQFIADFKYFVRPMHTEFLQSWFHKREPLCIPQIDTCSADPGYPVQVYNSANTPC
ncbi:MAG TPA: hypothetical protein VF077_12910 [Nitrospiraceae bacterium]